MLNYKTLLHSTFFLLISFLSSGQGLLINEIMGSNGVTLLDEDGDSPDWIELYNNSTETVDLAGYGISDDQESRWIFPSFNLPAGDHLLIYASDKNRKTLPSYWETMIDRGDEWSYVVPAMEYSGWREVSYDASSWLVGSSGFGYGDGDDATILNNVQSVFIRKTFDLNSISNLNQMILHMDYDDGFVAYLNGVEVARDNITSTGPPPFNDRADNGNHEAGLYNGGEADIYVIENLAGILNIGTNVLAIQVHNAGANSSDLTCIPFLSVGWSQEGDYEVSEEIQLPQFGGMHTDFKISSGGESIYLTNPSGEHLDSVVTPLLKRDVSYGRAPDGTGDFKLFSESTPNESNGMVNFEGYSGEVFFSRPDGFYSSSQEVVLSVLNEEEEIYYTLDGETPTRESALYTSPITVSGTTVLKAIAASDRTIEGDVGTRTYILGDTHDGLPVVSISTDPSNLWDEDRGIFVLGTSASSDFPFFGANFWDDTEIPVHVSFFDVNRNEGFSIQAGAKIFGAYSRGNDQKSLALHFRKSYEGALNYPMFSNLGITSFKSLVLRNSGNDWNYSMLRDGLMSQWVHEEVDHQAYRPAVAYINGAYWGILNIREKVNEDFLEAHHGVDADEISIVERNGLVVEGSSDHYRDLISYVESHDLSVDENYEYVSSQMDVSNFIKYMVLNVFLDNTDWPGNNIKFWRPNTAEGKWKWITFDKDFGMGLFHGNYANNTVSFALEGNGPNWPNPPWSTLLLRKLMENESFKNEFLLFFMDELNTTYSVENTLSVLDETSGLIQGEIGDHMRRWNAWVNWNTEVSSIRNFLSNRPNVVKSHLRSVFSLGNFHQITIDNQHPDRGHVKINGLSIESESWRGEYAANIPVPIVAVPKEGFRFVGWGSEMSDNSREASLVLTGDMNLRPVFALNGVASVTRSEEEYFLVYPNPVKEESTLRIKTNYSGQADIVAYDLTGKSITTVFSGVLPAGNREIEWDHTPLSAGVYLIRLISDDHEETVRLIKS